MNDDMNSMNTNIQATLNASSELVSLTMDTAVSTLSGKFESLKKPSFVATLSANMGNNNNNNLNVEQTATPNLRLRTTAGGSRLNFDGTPLPSPPNRISPATDFERMIWVGRINNTVTTEIMEKYIAEHFTLPESAKVIVKCLISKDITDLSTVPSLSYKISVDSEDTFDRLINPKLWPRQCRIREFFNRPRTASLNDFLPLSSQQNNLIQQSQIETQTAMDVTQQQQQQ